MWGFVPEAIRAPNLFTKPILVDSDERLWVEVDEGVKVQVSFFFRYENAFAQVAVDPGLLFTK